MTSHTSAIVVGAGVSGLVCTYALRKSGIDAILLESSVRPGGVIRSEQREGFLFECGPQSFTATPALLDLIDDLGLAAQLVEAPAGAPRFVLLDGELREVPLSPQGLLTSSILGLRTKSTFMTEALGKSIPPEPDESIADFVRRKFTPELLDRLVSPFVSGVYAGDPEKLSLRATFRPAYEAEKRVGSVLRGLKEHRERNTAAKADTTERSSGPKLFSFRRGMQTLTDALAGRLGSFLHTSVEILDIRYGNDVLTVTGKENGTTVEFAAGCLVIATPTHVASKLVASAAAPACAPLDEIEYAPVAVVSLAYPRKDVAHDLRGFGFLIPRSARIRTLGCVWNSSLFPDRAPDTHLLLTSFVGGATDPGAINLSNEQLRTLVHSELASILSLKNPPCIANITVHGRAIPQYTLGHLARIDAIRVACSSVPGLFITGNYFDGPSIGSCIDGARAVANQVRIRYNS